MYRKKETKTTINCKKSRFVDVRDVFSKITVSLQTVLSYIWDAFKTTTRFPLTFQRQTKRKRTNERLKIKLCMVCDVECDWITHILDRIATTLVRMKIGILHHHHLHRDVFVGVCLLAWSILCVVVGQYRTWMMCVHRVRIYLWVLLCIKWGKYWTAFSGIYGTPQFCGHRRRLQFSVQKEYICMYGYWNS